LEWGAEKIQEEEFVGNLRSYQLLAMPQSAERERRSKPKQAW